MDVARRAVEAEIEVDVNEMAVGVDQNILVVSVLDGKDVAEERVACKRLDEVFSGLLEIIHEHYFENRVKVFCFVQLFQLVD